ncbi:hypothetical protein COX68_00720 [Candidatus Falkowbacteria bacterium CG_4_10_14_0_2_um_filter_41_15]|uniref:Uncharacterized protein n=2 Tax=Candidatus Falkowiibacteriota TaxID=1752728 RepID=A0A1J4T757_9BACT|nr:MAG: hypothetical protein AUJ35_02545 [Candidatus Falkowbacteria bacterium CG1_02_41_21]PJA10354.1 MAG: hypothetical protein COX68_00720 [Candidatus Falkowbacteria bacterium CG_4_10_14_0_2_um_filter_41_15]
MNNENYQAPENLDADGLTAAEREIAEYYLSLMTETKIPEGERRECSQEVVELQNMFVAFEAKHSLDELCAIVDLTVDEAPNNLIRETAKKDLAPMAAALKVLQKETNIATDKYDELEAQYRRLSSAVGIINSNKVRH